VLPQTLGRISGISYAAARTTAASHDFTTALHRAAPIVVAFVLRLAFVLLMMPIRSLAIPATAIGLNLLSADASYGLLKLIFQDGHLVPCFASPTARSSPWMRCSCPCCSSGWSTDHQVFILSRIREQQNRGATTNQAITSGISSTATGRLPPKKTPIGCLDRASSLRTGRSVLAVGADARRRET
jgi:RND superfamily putative drug exporter